MHNIQNSLAGRVVSFFLFSIACIVFPYTVWPQGLGAITKIQVSDNSLILTVGYDVVVFKACTENILMVNYQPNGIKDPDTLVVAKTDWLPSGALIDTLGDPLRISTSRYAIDIDRNPLRFHLYGKNPDNSIRWRCDEPIAGGINQNKIDLITTGGSFYGVHNRSQGGLSSPSGGTVFAGNQGQAGGPFIWTNQGWGFLADADGGKFTINTNNFTFERNWSGVKNDIEFYFLVGTPKEIIKQFHEVTGFPPLFPKYTLGFLNTEWGIDQTELYNDIRTYRQKSIPIDAYILDFDWMDWGKDNYGEFRWGSKFPDGQSGAIVDTLNRYGMHLMGIRKPRVHLNTVQGQYCQAQGFFSGYGTDYFSGLSIGLLNFHLPAVRKWYWESFALQGNSYAKGITGYWNDEADEYGGNLMFMQMQRSMYEGQRSFNTKRVWSINRNFYTGAQRYAYGLWSGDIQSGFSAMAEQRLFMLSSIVLGASWWGMDIGGFAGNPTPENYYRWIQFGAFVPIFRVHAMLNQEREPWYFDAQAEAIATKYIRLRYQLMPYIYSAAWENHFTGVSISRPLVFEYPDDPWAEDIYSEWMFGGSLLVSPVVQSGVMQQTLYLPQGTWYDFNTGAQYAGPQYVIVPITADDIPIFVKAGAVIPMSPPSQYVDSPEMNKVVILSSYPGGTGQCTIYDDDGVSYDYESGSYSTTMISHERNEKRAVFTIAARNGSFVPPQRDWLCELNWISYTPDSVILDGSKLKFQPYDSLTHNSVIGWSYDQLLQKSDARFPDDGKVHSLLVYLKSVTGVYGRTASPFDYSLGQNYPNPFNPKTKIEFSLRRESSVKLIVTDLLGSVVATIVDEKKPAGKYSVSWDASAFPSGVYFYTLNAGSFLETKPMLLLK